MNRIRKRKRLKLKTKILIIISLIISLTYFFMHYYLNSINPRIVEVANQKVNQTYRYFLSSNVSYDLLKNLDLEDLLIINKNAEGEILNVDFDLDRSYKILDIVTNELTRDITNLENNSSFYLELPLLSNSKYALLSNLGPKIYVQVNMMSNLLTNLETKITNYGINNALAEIYITIELDYELLSPIIKTMDAINYDVLISSKILNGRVPAIYGDGLTKNLTDIRQNLSTN